MTKLVNPRKKHLMAICTKIATFIVTETYTDEQELQAKLALAVKLIDEVSTACVANDENEKANTAQ